MSSKTPLQSLATLTEMVLPNDTNNLDALWVVVYYIDGYSCHIRTPPLWANCGNGLCE